MTCVSVDGLTKPLEFGYRDHFPDSTSADRSDNPRTLIEYDALGRKTAQIDPAGIRTEFEYDQDGSKTDAI